MISLFLKSFLKTKPIVPIPQADIFRPQEEPAKTIYDAFEKEAEARKGKPVKEWILNERKAVHKAACHYAISRGYKTPTLEEVECAEKQAVGSVDYGAKWARKVAALFK